MSWQLDARPTEWATVRDIWRAASLTEAYELYAERIAEGRREGAAEALEAFAIGCDETARTAYTSEARHFAEAYARRARDRAAALRGDAR